MVDARGAPPDKIASWKTERLNPARWYWSGTLTSISKMYSRSSRCPKNNPFSGMICVACSRPFPLCSNNPSEPTPICALVDPTALHPAGTPRVGVPGLELVDIPVLLSNVGFNIAPSMISTSPRAVQRMHSLHPHSAAGDTVDVDASVLAGG